MFFGSPVLTLVAGTVLLAGGRRVYWLLVGLVGFVLGFALAGELLEGPPWLILGAGLAAGLLASVLAVFFQKVMLAVAGFLIGGLTVIWWSGEMGWGEPWWVWGLALLAGAVGAALTRAVFEVALVLLSSVFGATLVLEALHRPTHQMSLLFVVLVTAGVVVQFLSSGRRRSK